MDKKTEEDIIKCSRCGLCADVCPVYKAKHTESALLRGKFLQLLGLIKGELKYSKRLKASIAECLGCEKCKIQCPSGLSAKKNYKKIKYKNLNLQNTKRMRQPCLIIWRSLVSCVSCSDY